MTMYSLLQVAAEAAGRIQTAALIFAALIEGVALFGAVIAYQIQGKL